MPLEKEYRKKIAIWCLNEASFELTGTASLAFESRGRTNPKYNTLLNFIKRNRLIMIEYEVVSLFYRKAYWFISNLSRFITFTQAAIKSLTNFSLASVLA